MADVFLSYASADEPVAERLARALERAGFSVWWDRHIRGGADFSSDIERELEAAGRVLVLWSKAGNRSRWVRDEASTAADGGRLVGVSIDGSRPPLGFRQFQTLDISGWARRPGKPLPQSVTEALSAAATPPTWPVPAAEARQPRRLVIAASIAALLVVALAAGWWRWGSGNGEDKASSGAVASLAVVPFKALSSGPDDRYLAAGLTEELVAHLARIPNLNVSSRLVDSEAGAGSELAAKLGAGHLVEGTVRRSGRRLRVTARLIRASDSGALWSGSYDSESGDMLDIQARIASQVAGALNVLLSPTARQQMVRMGVRNPDAYIAFAKGNEAYERAHRAGDMFGDLVEANRHFDEAFRLAPTLWQARERSADLYVHLLVANAEGAMPPTFEALGVEGARGELHRRIGDAIRAAPDASEQAGLAVISRAFSSDWTGLLRLVGESYRQRGSCGYETFHMFLGPNHGLARELGEFGRRAIECDRTSLVGWNALAQSRLLRGQPREALAVLEQASRTVDSAEADALKFASAFALLQLGRAEDAQATIASVSNPLVSNRFATIVAAESGDRNVLEARRAALPATALTRVIFLSAWSGDRDAANRAAAALDSRTDGPVLLESAVAFCMCGWPFDLAATPNYAARLREAGALAQPPRPLRLPLKRW